MVDAEPAVAVVGGAGFLGRALIDYCRQKGECVTSYTRARPALRNDGTLDHQLTHCRTIFWLASGINPLLAETHPELVSRDLALLRAFTAEVRRKRFNVRIVLSSSGGTVYGDMVPPFLEQATPAPVSAYGRAKLALEEVFGADTQGDRLVLRVANAYGPGQPVANGQGVIAHWLRAIRRGEDIAIYGNPQSTRDYVYIHDIVDAFWRVHSCRDPLPQIINIGSGVPTALCELANVVREVVGEQPVSSTLQSGRIFDQQHSCLDVGLAQEVLGWSAATSLRTGIYAAWQAVRTYGDPTS